MRFLVFNNFIKQKSMIRNVTPADAKAITDIYNQYILNTTISFETEPLTAEQMGERIKDISTEYPYYVYENEDGTIGGYCYAHRWKEREAYSHTLETTIYLAHGIERRGIGTQLMHMLIDECRHRGFVALIACITGDNEASIKMHASLGFEQKSCFEKVGIKFGKMLDVVDMELLL